MLSVIKKGINEKVSGSVRLRNEDGFCVDVNETGDIPHDMMLIRMNVDDFEEGYQFLSDHGFKNAMGEGNIIEAPYLKAAHMASPSGLGIVLMQHIKE